MSGFHADIGHNRASFDAVVEENLQRGVYLVHLQALQRCIKDPRLDQRHRLVLVALSECTNSKDGLAYPGRAWLAKKITYYQQGEPRQYSEGTIANTLSELDEFEYLTMRRKAPVGGGRALAHYAITSPANEELLAKIAEACAIIKANPKRPFPGANVTSGVDVNTGVDLRPDVNSGVAADVNSGRGQELVRGTGNKISAAEDAAPQTAASTSRGSRLPLNWALPEDWRAWTHSEFRVSAHQIQLQADTFRDYWHATPGQKGTKLDWQKTWANWCRRSFAKFHLPRSQQQTASSGDKEREAYYAQLQAAESFDP